MTETALPLSQKAAQLFAERGFENARLEAELLLAHVLRLRRLDLYLQFERPLSRDELETFRALVRRRLKREPLQYIVGSTAFRQLELQVDRRVLIPRPETEVLAGVAIDWARGQPGLSALDIGTGSGAIALSLLHEHAAERVVATDISHEALALARTNAERLGHTSRIEFRCGSLWEPVERGEVFDIVISNPPYVAAAERAELQPEVRDWEPPTALFAAGDGFEVISAISAHAHEYLRADGLLALEVGMNQAQRVAAELRAQAAYHDVKIVRDLAGRDRVVTALRKVES